MASITARTVASRAATSDVHVSLWTLAQRTRLWTKLWFGGAERAHDRRRASEAAGAEAMRDTGLDPETASGIHAFQAELPFFMQSGFGKR